MQHNFRSRLLATSVLASVLTVIAAPAFAQEAGAPETIVVTGTRIVRPDYSEVVPIKSITSDDILRSGTTNVVNVLRDLPGVGVSTFSGTNSNFDVNNSGVETLNLRNLGDSRTLVLVDGRRWVAGVAGDTAVDFNSIPTQFIDRVEVITGGASAVYGSEAIAGVVNIITKDKYNGLTAQAQYGGTDRGGGDDLELSVLAGEGFDQDRGHLLVTVGYNKTKAIYSRQRSYAAVDNLRDTDTGEVTLPQYSSFGAGGRFWSCGDQFCDDGSAVATGGAVQPWSSLDFGFNRDGQRLIQVPTERFQIASKISYDLNNNITLFGEAYYTKTKSDSELEPFPLANDDLTDGDTTVGVPITSPYVPAALLAEATLNGASSIPFFRRLVEIANRGAINDRDTYRIAVGAKGNIEKINWDFSYVRGEFKQSQISTGQVDEAKFLAALDATVDGSGNIVCASAAARAEGCAPLNIFGPGSISAAARDYVSVPSTRDAKVTQDVVALNFTGDAFELPAGPIGWAAGAEYRREASKTEHDILTQLGTNAGNATPNIKGSFNVKEVYGEILIPVFKDLPWAYSANIEAAARFGDYSTVGSVFNWKVGGDYSPIEGLTLRGAYAEASRAPNVGELFDPGSEDFPTVVDVCEGVTATSSRPQDTNCRAIPGMTQRIIDDGGTFTLNPSEIQGVSGFERGNTALNEETAKTFTVGLVYQPSFIPRSALTIDYYHIKVQDAIDQVDQNYAISQCYLTNDPTFCSTITRNNRAAIIQADAALANIATTKVEGVDVTLAYRLPLEQIGFASDGNLDFSVKYNHEFKNASVAIPGSPEDDLAGYLGAEDAAGGPKDRATFDILYSNSGWSFDWTTHYLGKVKAGTSATPLVFPAFSANGIDFTSSTIGSWWSHDVQLRYDWDKYAIYIGSRNVFDEDPPIIGEGVPGVNSGTSTAAALYDVIGRTLYIGAKATF